nr:transcriptional activator of proteases prtt [Quercus suber]
MGDRRTLSEVRSSSPLLLAAVCTVGALHMAASPEFERCYQDFASLAAQQTFSRRNGPDDVRGLCIAAFWLSGISWACIGAAVRISSEIGLHRSIFKSLQGDRTHYLRTRLYYLVQVCDGHFSVAYGRPPMTRQDETAKLVEAFLASEHAVEDDARLVSQVIFWTVGREIFDLFGVDVERPLSIDMIEPLRRLSIKLDNVRADWTERFSENKFVGSYPRKGVGLHYHFMKLYLYSMAFRGIGKPGFRSAGIALDIDELANGAMLSATAIIRAIVSDAEIQSYLNGLPTYFDLMIAFAVVFVLKVSTKYASSVRVDTSEIKTLVTDLVRVLEDVTAPMHPRHLLASVAQGAAKLLERCYRPADPPMPANSHVTMSQPTFDDSLYDMTSEWNGAAFDNFFMGEFDFLSNQDPLNGFGASGQYQQMDQR